MISDNRSPGTAIADDVPIWRYMDLPKFIAMLDSKSLWFAQAAQFHDDPYEGFCNVKKVFIPPDEHGTGPLRLSVGHTATLSSQRMFGEFSQLAATYLENARQHLFINSWCLAAESMAMWEIYGNFGRGIAIKSSTGRYDRALQVLIREEQFVSGEVKYHEDISIISELQFDVTEKIPAPGPEVWKKITGMAFHKRTCFEHEREWRAALYQDIRPDDAGRNINCDLDKLVDSVYVGPKSDRFFYEIVSSVTEKYGLERLVTRSTLLDPPAKSTL